MTPKEKAKELQLKYYVNIPLNCLNLDENLPKKMALLAVDLIIYHTEEDSSNIPLYEYYKEVRKELEKI